MITVSHEPGLFTMADVNVNAPEVPSTADAPPTRSDEQILSRDKWVPVGKSNCFLDVERTQTNPIFSSVILKKHQLLRGLSASSLHSIHLHPSILEHHQFDKAKDTFRGGHLPLSSIFALGKGPRFERPRLCAGFCGGILTGQIIDLY
ncbi:hypothetical protein Tco_0890972 [Tanacetum coccineum]|uniref:Uncharacterized protein n=1 Tax=Tanacetum coccineum TaxID=301880 RepID=A0ABQ5C1Y1_9ASTR